MEIATMGARLNKRRGLDADVEISDEINACSYEISVDENGTNRDYLLMFKNETHNHPTEIEPFGGAATCLGGAIRDPLSGRAYVYQSMRVTGSGDPTAPIERNDRRETAAEKNHDAGGIRVFLLRKPDRTLHRTGAGILSSELCRETHGSRRSDCCSSERKCRETATGSR
jgi:hypothetical protein